MMWSPIMIFIFISLFTNEVFNLMNNLMNEAE